MVSRLHWLIICKARRRLWELSTFGLELALICSRVFPKISSVSISLSKRSKHFSFLNYQLLCTYVTFVFKYSWFIELRARNVYHFSVMADQVEWLFRIFVPRRWVLTQIGDVLLDTFTQQSQIHELRMTELVRELKRRQTQSLTASWRTNVF